MGGGEGEYMGEMQFSDSHVLVERFAGLHTEFRYRKLYIQNVKKHFSDKPT